jgi:hypothetical protein
VSDTPEQVAAQDLLLVAIERCMAAYEFPTDGAVGDYLVVFAYQRVDEDGDLVERIDQIVKPQTPVRSVGGLVMYAEESVRGLMRYHDQ